MRNNLLALFTIAGQAIDALHEAPSGVCGIDIGLFPGQPTYDTGTGGATAAAPATFGGLKRLDRKTIVNPAMAPASSPNGVPKQTAGTAIALTVPAGCTELVIMKGALREVDGTGDEADLLGADVKILAGTDVKNVKEGDTLSITPEWECDDNDTKAKGTMACELLLFWF